MSRPIPFPSLFKFFGTPYTEQEAPHLARAKKHTFTKKNRPDEFFQSNIFYFLVHPSEAKLDDSNGPIGRPRPDWPTKDNKMLGD